MREDITRDLRMDWSGIVEVNTRHATEHQTIALNVVQLSAQTHLTFVMEQLLVNNALLPERQLYQLGEMCHYTQRCVIDHNLPVQKSAS